MPRRHCGRLQEGIDKLCDYGRFWWGEFNVSEHTDAGETLKAAREIIVQQQSEINALRSQLSDQQFVRELRQAVVVASTAGTITAPITHSHLLELLLRPSSHCTSAKPN